MKPEKLKLFLLFLVGGLVGILGMYVYQNQNNSKSQPQQTTVENSTAKSDNASSIDELTAERTVIDFVKLNKKLPSYYITKKEARNSGWIPSKGNLCDVLPGNAIGGDYFSNRENTLPKGKYFEADVNYHCGNRNADRIVFNTEGEVWLTKNHYKSFQKQ